MTDNVLAGVRVLVTRPSIQGRKLVEAIESCGGTAVRFPVMDIVGRDPVDISGDAKQMSDPDIVIYVSVNAVRFGEAHAGSAQIAAIGPATTRVLQERGLEVTIRAQDGFSSEHLLATPELQQVDGKVVRIIRGNGGRELLADTLRERGARVEYLEVYTRRVPYYSAEDIAAVEQQLVDGEIGCITIMSVESFVNLLALLPSTCHDSLQETLLVTPADRVIKEVETRFPGIPTILAQGPQAGDMVAAIATGTNTGQPDD